MFPLVQLGIETQGEEGQLKRAQGRDRKPRRCTGPAGSALLLLLAHVSLSCDKWHLANHVKLRICWYDSSGLMGGGGEEEASWLTRRTSKKNSFLQQQILAKARELYRGIGALLSFLHFCFCSFMAGVAVGHRWWLNDAVFWWPCLLSPAQCRLSGNVEEQPLPAQPEDGSLWSHARGNLDFITICLKVTITQSVYGALSVYFLIYMTPLDGKSRALLPTDCGIL